MHALRLAAAAAFLCFASANADLLPRDLAPPSSPREGWGYIGCYVDSVAARALDGPSHYDSAGLTAETCVAYCADAGYSYAGTEYSVECCEFLHEPRA